ncbi:MAG: HEAT repeat domain-containing protein [Oligoflexia bacterium]|nr:HEAT repeat domain-containing protein [Oligoflexia bacterium]
MLSPDNSHLSNRRNAETPELTRAEEVIFGRMHRLLVPWEVEEIESSISRLGRNGRGLIALAKAILQKHPAALTDHEQGFLYNIPLLGKGGLALFRPLLALMQKAYEGTRNPESPAELAKHVQEGQYQAFFQRHFPAMALSEDELARRAAETYSNILDHGSSVLFRWSRTLAGEIDTSHARDLALFVLSLDRKRMLTDDSRAYWRSSAAAMNMLETANPDLNLDLALDLYCTCGFDASYLKVFSEALSPQAVSAALTLLFAKLELLEEAEEDREPTPRIEGLEQILSHHLESILPHLSIKLEPYGRHSGCDQQKASALRILALKVEDLSGELKQRALEAALPLLDYGDLEVRIGAIRVLGKIGQTPGLIRQLSEHLKDANEEILLEAAEAAGLIAGRILDRREAEEESVFDDEVDE